MADQPRLTRILKESKDKRIQDLRIKVNKNCHPEPRFTGQAMTRDTESSRPRIDTN
jgi:hypothetical protein